MDVAVIFGPDSGQGMATGIAGRLADRLRDFRVAVPAGRFGCDPLPSSWLERPVPPSHGYVDNLRAAVVELLAWGAETLICVGGDGLASYALDALVVQGADIPLLGIAAGTINVGPIIAFSLNDTANLDIRKLSVRRVDAVEVLAGGAHIAYALNDVVVGNSFLGTLDGRTVSLSARALLREGKKIVVEPSEAIATELFELRKNGARIDIALGRPAQIVASPLGPREFFGRAVAGVLCEAAFMRGAGAIGIFDEIIVKACEPTHGFRDTARAEHILFGPDDLIEISGLAEDADIIVDGNPFAREGRAIQLRFSSAIAKVYVPAHLERECQDCPLEEARP